MARWAKELLVVQQDDTVRSTLTDLGSRGLGQWIRTNLVNPVDRFETIEVTLNTVQLLVPDVKVRETLVSVHLGGHWGFGRRQTGDVEEGLCIEDSDVDRCRAGRIPDTWF